MGVFKKLKDIFYDEEIIEEDDDNEVASKPVIREVKKEPIKKQVEPVREIPKEREVKKELNTEAIEFRKPEENRQETYNREQREVSERELYQSKQTFKFPILDDEEEFETRRIKKTRSGSTNIMDVERRNREIKRKEEVKEPVKPKVFKPSPVISPVYGIMDKDYDKTELMNRSKEIANANRTSTSTDYDSIRKKAYGVKEDVPSRESVKREASKVLENVNEIEEELEKVKKKKSNIESLLQSIEDNANLTVGDMEKINEVEDISAEVSRLDKYKKTDAPKKTLEEIGDKTLEHDLFNLIDSMYDEEDKE